MDCSLSFLEHVIYLSLTSSFHLPLKVKDKHLVVVEIRDLDGAPNGLFNTATATITVGDVNDNPPTFTKASVSASLEQARLDVTCFVTVE